MVARGESMTVDLSTCTWRGSRKLTMPRAATNRTRTTKSLFRVATVSPPKVAKLYQIAPCGTAQPKPLVGGLQPLAQPGADVGDLLRVDLVLHRIGLPDDRMAERQEPIARPLSELHRNHRIVQSVSLKDRRFRVRRAHHRFR